MTDFFEEPKPIQPKVIGSQIDFKQDESENKLIIVRSQEIPDDFRMENRKIREDSMSRPEGEFMHCARIPVEVAWDLKENFGYDVWKEPIRETIKYLRAAGLDDFIVTNKRV